MLTSQPLFDAQNKPTGWRADFAGISDRVVYVVCASP
jgi:hypothetical protein